MRMIPRVDTRMYTNLMLTIIALVLVAMVAREFGFGVVGTAQAQQQSRDSIARRNVPDLERTDTGVVIDSQIPQTQDVAVAQATSEVAASNREIAAAIQDLASAVREAGSEMRAAAQQRNTGAPAGATPAAASERPVIEVAP